MMHRYVIAFWFSAEVEKDQPDYWQSVDAETLDLAIVQVMQACGVSMVADVSWCKVLPDDVTQVYCGGWRFDVTLDNPGGASSLGPFPGGTR